MVLLGMQGSSLAQEIPHEFLMSDYDLLLVFEFWWARAPGITAVRRPGGCVAFVLETERLL